ncbi:G- protein-coupled receptor [Steccherinum ochraceum]|uniref:G-protein-coupled receptor n=1 Tax=Steccherinum ochraceum TaxID=92696 RepID=A0A4R0R7P5_9APHY|nr:G- protein-coupled receptor [Steccherinum ochraceum]
MPFSASTIFSARFVLSALAAIPFVAAASVSDRGLEARAAAPACDTAKGSYTDYVLKGCSHDSAKRALTGHYYHAPGQDYMDAATCTSLCSSLNFTIAGVETGRECYCGNSFSNGEGYALPASSCGQIVSGQPAGGPWALSIYEATRWWEKFSSPSCAVPSGWKSDNWEYLHCAHDGAKRALTGYYLRSNSMSSELCTSTCASKGYKIAGVEVGYECYCGNELENGEGYQIDSKSCNIGFPVGPTISTGGDLGAGGQWALSLYQVKGMSRALNKASVPIPAAPKNKRSPKEIHLNRNVPTSF